MLAVTSCSMKTVLQYAVFLGHSREVVCELVTSFRSFCSHCAVPPSPKYGGRHTVAMIPGDGIGPELMVHVKKIFRSNCVPVDFEEVSHGKPADTLLPRDLCWMIQKKDNRLKVRIT